MADGYCPRCGSKLYPQDEKYMKAIGVCSYCGTYNQKFREELAEHERVVQEKDKKRRQS